MEKMEKKERKERKEKKEMKERKAPQRGSNGTGSAAGGGDGMATFRVPVPPDVRPGGHFQVFAEGRIVRVKVPRDVRLGQWLQITVPVRDASGRDGGDGTPPRDSDNVTRVPNQVLAPGEQPAYMVTIPEGVRRGQQFPVTIQGKQLTVTCPNMARPGNSVRIVPPPPPRDDPNGSGHPRIANPNKRTDSKTQEFEVIVPNGVTSGERFALLAGGVRVLVTCPMAARSGHRIRFNLPVGLFDQPEGPKCKLSEIKLSYDKDECGRREVEVTDVDEAQPVLDEEPLGEEGPPKFPTADEAPGSDVNILREEWQSLPRGTSLAVAVYLATAAFVGAHLARSEQKSLMPWPWIIASEGGAAHSYFSNVFPLVLLVVWALALRALLAGGRVGRGVVATTFAFLATLGLCLLADELWNDAVFYSFPLLLAAPWALTVSFEGALGRAGRCVVATVSAFLATGLLSFLADVIGYDIALSFFPCFFDCLPDVGLTILAVMSAYMYYSMVRGFVWFMGKALRRLQVAQENRGDFDERDVEDQRLPAHGKSQDGKN